jgi:TM2 domain-containing membrane protein YozV
MSASSNVYEKISETKRNSSSKRSRILVFFFAFIFPIGLHNYYLGYHIKGIIQTFMIVLLGSFVPPILFLLIFPFYIAWITSEGLVYLLWYDVKDGNDFPMYDRSNPQKPEEKYAIIMAFLLPFGLHNFYLGRFKRGIIAWGFVVIILTINLIFLIHPILLISLNFIFVVVLISWIEGLLMIIKKNR